VSVEVALPPSTDMVTDKREHHRPRIPCTGEPSLALSIPEAGPDLLMIEVEQCLARVGLSIDNAKRPHTGEVHPAGSGSRRHARVIFVFKESLDRCRKNSAAAHQLAAILCTREGVCLLERK